MSFNIIINVHRTPHLYLLTYLCVCFFNRINVNFLAMLCMLCFVCIYVQTHLADVFLPIMNFNLLAQGMNFELVYPLQGHQRRPGGKIITSVLKTG